MLLCQRGLAATVLSWICVQAAALGLPQRLAAQEYTPPDVHQARSTRGMVVSASKPASIVGRDVLADGGNAVDSAIAVAFALAVTWPEAGNIGGGGFMMVHRDGEAPVCIEYRECAPAAAHRTMYTPGESTYTHRAVGVPGTVAGLAVAHKKYGSRPWPELVMPAVRLAREGFAVDSHLAISLNGVLTKSNGRGNDTFAELARVYGKRDGSPWQAGDRMVLPELADTLERIAERGPREFYEGKTAVLLVEEMQRGRGLINKQDLAEYEAFRRAPIHATYRGYDVYGPPPPSSGGICLALMLNVLETFDLRQQPLDSPRTLHLITESMRRAYLDRARSLADPAFVKIPEHLTSKEYARQLAASIDQQQATPSESLAPELEIRDEGPSTTHFSIVDSSGLAVSNTYTLEASYGARIVVPGAGFLLNNEMGDFNWYPGHTDRSGRIGTPPNTVAPGKRMLSSQTPVIVARNGKAILITGTPGGRTIINTVLLTLIRSLEYEQDLAEAIKAPRMHHGWLPDQLSAERGSTAWNASIKALRQMSHTVHFSAGQQGAAHSIAIDEQTGERHGVADWRRGGFAAGE